MKLYRTFLACVAAVALVASCHPALEELHETPVINGAVGSLQGNVDRPAVEGKTCPVAIIAHGLTGHRSEAHLMALADSLYAHGIAVVRFDFNGHGESEGEFVNMTLDNEVQDLLKIYDYVASLPWVDNTRIALAGHSQGGLVSGVVAGDLGAEKVKCLLLLAPAACIHTMASSGSMFGQSFDAELPDYIEFWGGRHLGKNYLLSARDMDVFGRTAKYEGPAYVLQGTNDSPELIADAKKYPTVMPNCEYLPLYGLTHCFPEDLEFVGGVGSDFIISHLK